MSNLYGPQLIFTEPVSAVTATPSTELGTRRSEGGKDYVYVYNAGATSANVGYGVIQSAMSGFSVTVSSSAGQKAFGVVQNADIPGGSYGYVQVRGQANVYLATNHGGATLGKSLYLTSNGGFGAYQTGATGSTWLIGTCATVLESSISTSGTGSAYINCIG